MVAWSLPTCPCSSSRMQLLDSACWSMLRLRGASCLSSARRRICLVGVQGHGGLHLEPSITFTELNAFCRQPPAMAICGRTVSPVPTGQQRSAFVRFPCNGAAFVPSLHFGLQPLERAPLPPLRAPHCREGAILSGLRLKWMPGVLLRPPLDSLIFSDFGRSYRSGDRW